MAQTLGSLAQERAGPLAGRQRERALLGGLLDDDGPVIAYLHGLAGVGKSALARAFAADARAAGAVVSELDWHVVYPTRGTFLEALAGRDARTAAGQPPTLEQAAAAVGERGERVVLLIDGYGLLRMLEHWLCHTALVALPANVRVVLTDRQAPSESWRRQYGAALRVLELENLPPDDAVALVRRLGLDERAAQRINAIAHGHPLSLQLAAEAVRDQPALALEELAVGTVGDELARIYLDGLDPATRRALDAASLTRRTTLSVLEAMLPDDPPADAFERLRRLPFVNLGPHGLIVHDTVREVASALLSASDPDTYWRLRAAAWSRLRAELRGAPRRDLGRYAADMIYLIEDPKVREQFFPATAGEQPVETARAEDRDAVEAFAATRMTPDELELLREWWELARERFTIVRHEDGSVAGFACLIDRRDVGARLFERDPLAAAWRNHLRADPPPRGQRTLFFRYLVPHATATAAQAALLLEVTSAYVELRPELRRVYAPASYLSGSDATCAIAMGYLPLAGHPDSVLVDFGPASVDGWLDELGARELRVDAGGEVEASERRLVLDGLQIDFTRLEAEVLGYLQRHLGEAVEREALLRDVWGYDWDGGSNVVDVVISSLRRKLGDRASALETVRGVGYRLRPLT